MATRTLDTKLSISGEKEYRDAISNINTGIKVLNAEMQKTTAEFQNNAGSVEALKAQTDVLTRRLHSEKEKVEELRDALSYAVEAHGEGSREAMNYQASLYKAEAQVANTEAAIERNTQAIENQTEAEEDGTSKTMDFGDAADQLADKLGFKLPDGIKNAISGMGRLSGEAVAAVGAVGAAIAAVKAGCDKLKEITIESAAQADDILTSSTKTSISTQLLQEWDYASDFIDVSTDTMTGSITKLIRSMDSARDTGGKSAEAFDTLGVRITDSSGQLRDSHEVFLDAIDALGEIENHTERDALSMELFGKSAQDLNPLIAVGSEGLRKYSSEAHEVGAVLSNDMLESLGDVDDAQQKLLKTQDAVTKQISVQYAPYMEKALTMTQSNVKKIGDTLIRSGIARQFGNILECTLDIIQPLLDLGEKIIPVLSKALSGVGYLLAGIADTAQLIKGVLEVITFQFGKGFTDIGNAMGFGYSSGNASHIQRWQMSYEGRLDQYDDFYRRNASGNDNFEGGVTRVGEAGPETVILPKGTQILSAQESRMSGGIYIGNITIDAKNVKEFNDVVRIVQGLSVDARMRG